MYIFRNFFMQLCKIITHQIVSIREIMAFDKKLAHRIQALVNDWPGMSQKSVILL